MNVGEVFDIKQNRRLSVLVGEGFWGMAMESDCKNLDISLKHKVILFLRLFQKKYDLWAIYSCYSYIVILRIHLFVNFQA
jgi:hypothetical protein